MNYDALDPEEPKGEVLIRGPLVFSGYYKDQVKTDEVLEKDGWFHSGEGSEISAARSYRGDIVFGGKRKGGIERDGIGIWCTEDLMLTRM